MDSDLANIGLICLLMGVGIVTFLVIALGYLAVTEFLETWYLED
jgi:small-conductance mechanosensitive channel